jgi:hypothetical protein
MGSFVDSLGWGIPWEMCNGEYANNTIESCNSCECEPVRASPDVIFWRYLRLAVAFLCVVVGAVALFGAAEQASDVDGDFRSHSPVHLGCRPLHPRQCAHRSRVPSRFLGRYSSKLIER